jgi:hypothetical protein
MVRNPQLGQGMKDALQPGHCVLERPMRTPGK